jgi:4-alpha-glucanotransferase
MEFSGTGEIELPRAFDAAIHRATLQGLLRCNSWLVIPMITDILGEEARFNVPGAAGEDNWTARLDVPVSMLDTAFATSMKRFDEALQESGRADE